MQEKLLPKKSICGFELKLTLTDISLVSFSNHCQNGSISRVQCSELLARLCINEFIVDEQLKRNHPLERLKNIDTTAFLPHQCHLAVLPW